MENKTYNLKREGEVVFYQFQGEREKRGRSVRSLGKSGGVARE